MMSCKKQESGSMTNHSNRWQKTKIAVLFQ